MKKSSNINEFANLIDSMKHRERFVFTANNALKNKYGKDCNIEIYNTILFESRNLDRNITIHLVDEFGDVLMKKAKLYRLWNPDFFNLVYGMIKSNNLELPE